MNIITEIYIYFDNVCQMNFLKIQVHYMYDWQKSVRFNYFVTVIY